MNKIIIAVLFSVVVLVSCSGESEALSERQNASESDTLNQLAEYYFEERIKLDPFFTPSIGDYRFKDQFGNPLSDKYIQAKQMLVKDCQQKLYLIDRNDLPVKDQITYDLMLWNFERELIASTFPDYLLPINQFRSRLGAFARYGSGKSAQPFNTVEDYEAFLKKSKGFRVWVETVIQRMREGIQQGIVLPKVLAVKILPQLSAHIVKNPKESIYWQPLENFPEEFSKQERVDLEKAYIKMIDATIVPSYQLLYEFIENEYLSKARSTAGYQGLRNGKAWYQSKIEHHTTTKMTADEIHKLGLKEVARILKEMDQVRKEVNYKGSLPEFLKFMGEDEQFFYRSSEEVIEAYTRVRAEIESVLPDFFEIKPKTDYIIRPVEAFRAASAAGASYESGSPDGTRPGVFFINTHNLKAQPKYILETLSIHEASPGHHFQTSIQMELKNIPRIRRFGGYTAYVEGWALYSESLGKEMGLFSDPYQYFGRLSDEMLRAMRLVVDTGLHAKGWTREQAILYMQDNSTMADSDIVAEVERYMAVPGQALAYKVGSLKIREMRAKAERKLGDKFDIRAFHTQVLLPGSIPIKVLDSKIKAWVEAQL